MSTKLFFLAIAATLNLCACNNEQKLGKQRTKYFSKVEEKFAEPGKDYRPVAFWVWNEKVNRDDIDRMLKDFKNEGWGGGFIHPRPGLINDYLSDEWFELWRYSLEKSRELGLDMWIYDENSYPSGFAGGHVQREMPESYDHATKFMMEELAEGEERATDEHSFIVEMDGRKFFFTEGSEESSSWTGGKPYVDLLYPGVTEKFIDITMSGYEKEFGKELGTEIKGIFTDEPYPLQFTPAMYEEFRKDWGYSIRENLPCLFKEVGNWKQVRFHYYSTLLRLFIEHWSKPWEKYCIEHGLLWTGHYWEHSWPYLKNGVDHMAMYEFHRMPAIDMLFNGFDETSPNAQWGNIRAVKELRSVANQMGYTRTLCESYGGGGWDMTFEDFKRLADWEYALGVNVMTQHYSNVSIVGARKYDYPDFFNSYSPWAEDYKTLNDHVARLSLALSQGDQKNDVVIIEPTTTTWMYYYREKNIANLDTIAVHFTKLVTGLEHKQLEYDLASETTIARHGSICGSNFVIGEREYSTVIIPEDVELLLPRTAELLQQFAAKGGKIIALSQPGMVNAYENEALQDLWNNKNISFAIDDKLFDNDFISFDNIEGGDLYHHRRNYKDGQLLFLANSSKTEAVKGSVTIKGGGLKELDTITGDIYLYPSEAKGANEVTFTFEIPAAGHLMLFAPRHKNDLKGLKPRTIRKSSDETIAPVTAITVKRISDNYLTLDHCRLTVDGQDLGESFVADACKTLFHQFDMENPWEHAIQYKQEAVEADTISRGKTDVEYKFLVGKDVDCSSFKLVCERPWLWEASVNGNVVTAIDGEHPLDSRNGAYAIGEYVHEGENIVILHLDRMSVFAEIAQTFICGDFSVVQDGDRWVIAAPQALEFGPWAAQGMPFYAWSVAYSGEYEIKNPAAGYILKLGKWEGTVCEVLVNGAKTDVIAYKPYESNLSAFLKEGINTVEVRCIGSLVNIYGPHFVPRKTFMNPRSWYGSGAKHNSQDYIFNNYGLEEPFEISIAK